MRDGGRDSLGGRVLPEQGHLTRVPLLLPRLGLAEGVVERRHELGAVPPE